MITAALLEEKIALMERQKEEHFAIYHQAVGAIGMLQHLKSLKDHLTMDELGEALGGKVESIEPVANETPIYDGVSFVNSKAPAE